MRTLRLPALTCVLLSVNLAACSDDPPPTGDDGPDLTLDTCNDATAAAAEASCTLPLDTEQQGYINPTNDNDWWVLDVPDLPARALLTVTAQYKVPATPVTLKVNVLGLDGRTSIGTAIDRRTRGPGPTTVLARVTQPGRYYVVVSHDVGGEDPAMDRRNPYVITATVGSDPDTHEPNDSAATAVTLPTCGTTTFEGALSVTGDVDLYSFTAALCPPANRTILHLRLSAQPSASQIRLGYVLTGPGGAVVAEGHTGTPFGEQLLLTARIAQAGAYQLQVKAYKASTDYFDPPGDPQFRYSARVGLYADRDSNEGAGGNDEATAARATAVPLNIVDFANGSPTVKDGRISFVGDNDYFAIQPSNGASPARLYYELTWADTGAQFERVPTTQPRELTLVTLTSTAADCLNNRAVCPSGGGEGAAYCQQKQCLRQRRVESADIPDFGHFKGMLYVPPNSGPYYLRVGFQGSTGADDLPYTLRLKLINAPATPHDTRPTAAALNLPATGTTVLGHGFGDRADQNAPNGLERLPRGPLDFDAEGDVEFYQMTFTPPETTDAGTPDQSMSLSWTISPGPGQEAGERSYDIGVRFHFCENPPTCSVIKTTSGFLGYREQQGYPWYNQLLDGGSAGLQYLWAFEQPTGRFEVRPVACMCLDGKYAKAGKFWVELKAHDRTSYVDGQTQLEMSVGPYPSQVPLDGDAGTSITCPVPCRFFSEYIQ